MKTTKKDKNLVTLYSKTQRYIKPKSVKTKIYKTVEHQKIEERKVKGDDEGKSTHKVKKEEVEGKSTHTVTMGMKKEDEDEARSGTMKRERKN